MLYAFGHRYGVGKDTACEYLIRQHGGIQLSFAMPLYDILHYAQKTCHFPQQKDRKFLQWNGTDWARNIQQDVWVKCLLPKITDTSQNNYFISDVRYPNEFDALKQLGFTLVKINRNAVIETNQIHASETALANHNWDLVLDNNGTLEEFYNQLDQLK